ncbi:MAG: B12-binding domain-containing radical SAM protein, partial [Cytophagaceae bacterium]
IMPWASPQIPSIQICALKSFLKEHLPSEVTVQSHHLHLSIANEAFSLLENPAFLTELQHEGNFLRLLLIRFGHILELPFTAKELGQDLENHFAGHPDQKLSLLDEVSLRRLQEATEKHLENSIVSQAKFADEVVIGMTTNFLQTFANVYAYFYLKERLPAKKLTFVFGGASMAYPQTIKAFDKLNVDGYVVIGEGEKKLLGIIRKCLEGNDELEDLVDGIFHVRSAPELNVWKESWFSSQIKSITELPLPDFQEYFDHLLQHQNFNLQLLKNIELPMEGSRGCVFTCEFCNLNRFWQGYRKLPGEEIAHRARKLFQSYPSRKIRFVDNLCDGWAEQYADELISKNEKINSIMELRPKHKDEYWDKLAQSGLSECQIGAEGLDVNVLKRIGKGTNLMDVIHAKKRLCEIGVHTQGNVITHYPRSTLIEVKNTHEVLKTILHFPGFWLTRFWLGIDSPLYEKLSPEQKQRLRASNKAARSLPLKYDELNVFFYYESPEELRPEHEVTLEWKKLIDWYSQISPSYWMENYLLMETDERDDVVIYDKRNSEVETVHRPDARAREILNACHAGKKMDQIVAASGFSADDVRSALDELISRNLIYKNEESYISLPLRMSKSELERRKKRELYF